MIALVAHVEMDEASAPMGIDTDANSWQCAKVAGERLCLDVWNTEVQRTAKCVQAFVSFGLLSVGGKHVDLLRLEVIRDAKNQLQEAAIDVSNLRLLRVTHVGQEIVEPSSCEFIDVTVARIQATLDGPLLIATVEPDLG